MCALTVKDLKKGDYFKLYNSKVVYVRGDYDRATKKYSIYRFDDVNKERFVRGTVEVVTDFEF